MIENNFLCSKASIITEYLTPKNKIKQQFHRFTPYDIPQKSAKREPKSKVNKYRNLEANFQNVG